jgi:hypothetical protein
MDLEINQRALSVSVDVHAHALSQSRYVAENSNILGVIFVT